MEQKPIIFRGNLAFAEPIAKFCHAQDPITAFGEDSQQSRRGRNGTPTPDKNRILFAGFEAADEEKLVALYGTKENELTFSKCGTDDLLLLGEERFEAVAIQVDSCELYAPAIMDFLQRMGVVDDETEVVAVTEYMIPNFVDQLRSSGCTNVLPVISELGQIFPARAGQNIQTNTS